MSDVDIHTLVGPYALDAVDDLERARFSRHLAECEACALELAELRETAGRLGDLAAETPPARLRSAVLAEISRTRQVGPGRRTPESGGAAGRWRRRVVAAAAAVVLAAGAATTTYVVQEQRAQQAQQVTSVLAAPDAVVRTLVVDGGRVTVVVSDSLDKGVAVFQALPYPGADKAYQLWAILGDHPDSRGVLAAGTGSGTLVFGDVRGAKVMAVSREPAGGSATPSNTVAKLPLA
jgi:anti-sigma-K factor RskA